MNKRGISAVVATILIVLLSVAAVVIIWQVLKPAIQKSAGRVGTGCIDIDLTINSADCVTSNSNMKVTLNAGTLTALKVAYYDANLNSVGAIQTITTGLPLALESKTLTLNPIGAGITKLNVATVVTSETGEELTCGFVLPTPRACNF